MNDAIGFTREDMAQEEREFFREHDAKIREDAIDECIKTIIDYCGGLPNGMYVNALKQLKGEKQ